MPLRELDTLLQMDYWDPYTQILDPVNNHQDVVCNIGLLDRYLRREMHIPLGHFLRSSQPLNQPIDRYDI